ncbi:hypothetical protein ACIRQP_19095 [Streptomyces sp. NPDC102274]|uniref:hypothetical protein n=1 Tax=Streptomyces sp. NPDC102274 TaxID=3366151 RepID=UPI003805D085
MGVSKQRAAENRDAITAAANGLFRERGVDADPALADEILDSACTDLRRRVRAA